MKSMIEPHVHLISKVLDMQLQRQNVVSGNLANLKTPGYKAKTLSFEKELQDALGLAQTKPLTKTHDRHIPVAFDTNGFGPDVEGAVRPRIIHGEDRVNLDTEMATLAKSSLHYSALTSVLKSNFEGIKSIITEGQK